MLRELLRWGLRVRFRLLKVFFGMRFWVLECFLSVLMFNTGARVGKGLSECVTVCSRVVCGFCF